MESGSLPARSGNFITPDITLQQSVTIQASHILHLLKISGRMYATNTLPISWNQLIFLLLLLPASACSQNQGNANNVSPPYSGAFDYGVNMGYFPPNYYDMDLAALVHGSDNIPGSGYGITSIRPGLFDYFLDFWGYDIRKEHFKYYDSIGLRNIVVISGFPAERNRDSAYYCPGERNAMFKNMYQPIWDEGQNGTPVNDNNPYALYIWKAVNTYKGLVKIWEVWNEPDAGGQGWLEPGQPGNWWENVPEPCDLAIKSPPFFYIRALRITYEIVKTVDPEALVAVGGLGYPSFLDVICRYTDEPFDGARDSIRYPYTGGAYFDCMSFHEYPHLDNSLRAWNNDIHDFTYRRNSDAALDGLWHKRDEFKAVLDKYGYNGVKYPEKVWICSEFNLPRKAFGNLIGSEQAQVNFLEKAFIAAQMENMAQMQVYSISDELPASKTNPEFSYMGLFKNLNNVPAGKAQPNAAAYAVKTVHDLLDQCIYDPVRTAALNLPEAARGAAFKSPDGQYTYVLWARTTLDRDETAALDYSFPAELTIRYVDAKPWHYSQTHTHFLMNGRQIHLTGSPVFLTETHITNEYPKSLQILPNPAKDGVGVAEFWIFDESNVNLQVFDTNGRLVKTIMNNEHLVDGPHARVIDLRDQPNGIYFVQLATPENNMTLRFVKN